MSTRPLPRAPVSLLAEGQFQTGTYRTPFAEVELSKAGFRKYRLKEWHYLSFTTPDWYVALGVVQLGYLGNLFAYAVDRGTSSAVEFGAMSPLGRATTFASSSVRGTTRWKSRTASVEISASDGFLVKVDVPLGGERLRGEARIEARESLAMLHRLGPRQMAYTHKAAAWPISGRLELGHRPIILDGGLGASDWTRSQARRVTEWKWASLSGLLSDGCAIGLNLSTDVYDDDQGHSVENAVWIDGQVRPLSGVRFEVPSDPETERWRIRSLQTDEVDLEFQPMGARKEQVNLGLVRTDFVQPFGRFEGRLAGHEVDGLFGVVEAHLSVW